MGNYHRPVTEFIWVKDAESYSSAADAMNVGIVPVMLPKEKYRQRRWKSVLEWYGLREAKGCKWARVKPPRIEYSCPLFVYEPELEIPAQAYASYLKRPCHLLRNDNDLEKYLNSRTVNSALIIERPERLRLERLQVLHSMLSVPWGILTARDLPGLTLAIAKLLSHDSKGVTGTGCVDTLSNEVREFDDGGWPSSVHDISRRGLEDFIFGRDWNRFAIHAHGEGAHVNLESVILCGLSGHQEQGPTGNVMGGCRSGPRGGRTCKRARNPNTVAVSVGELRARELYLFSCFGFSVSGERYPSDLSTVLSAAEGYPRMVLTSDRIAETYSEMIDIAFSLRALGVGTGALQKLYNDLEVSRSNFRSFVLWGDPHGVGLSWSYLDNSGEAELASECRTQPIQLGAAADLAILRLTDVMPHTSWKRGEHVAVVIRSTKDDARSCKILDATDSWTGHLRAFVTAMDRIKMAKRLECAIRGLLGQSVALSQEFSDRMIQLTSLRLDLEQKVHSGLRLCEYSRSQGVFLDQIEDATESTRGVMNEWDETFVEISLNHLFKEDFHVLVADGCIGPKRTKYDKCPRCGNTMVHEESCFMGGDTVIVFQEACLLCACQSTWTSLGGRLIAAVPSQLISGGIVQLSLSPQLDDRDFWAASLKGHLAVEASSGDQKVFHRRIDRITKWPHLLTIAVPPDISSDLSVFRFCWVRGCDVAFHTARPPSIRRFSN